MIGRCRPPCVMSEPGLPGRRQRMSGRARETCGPENGLINRHVMLSGMNQVLKHLSLWMVIGLIVILPLTVFQGTRQSGQEQPNFSDFLKAVEQGRVDSVVIRGNLVTYALKDGGAT